MTRELPFSWLTSRAESRHTRKCPTPRERAASAPEYWRLLDEPPLAEAATLRAALVDVFAVVSELANGDPISAVALKTARNSGLAGVARLARQRAAARMNVVTERLERALGGRGYSAHVLRREGVPESHRWPSDDFLILVEVPSIFAWQRDLGSLTDICRPLLEDRVGFFMAPVRDGKLVGSFAVKVFDNAFPADEVRDWPELPLPFVDEILYRECAAGLGGLVEVSGVVASVRGSEVHDEEAAVVEVAMNRANETLRYLDDLAAATDDPFTNEIGGAFLELARAVEAEAAALGGGKPATRGVAASVVLGFKGDPDDVFDTYAGLLTCCIEWDVQPEGAWSRFQAALGADAS